jgi:Resolvase, N terminal domain/Protein of unknown function (DUF2950)/Helix-turn-helix domain of resolvase
MIKRPSFPRPCSFPSLRWLTCLAVATAFLTIANGAVAQQRYNTPDEAVAALISATRTGAPALLMRVLGPGSDEIVSSGDPVADAFARKRLLDAYNIRHTRDLLNLLDAVGKAGAAFKSLGDAWADTTTPHGRLMLTVLGGLAEFERELILARTGAGRDRAKAQGVRFGRPPSLTPHQRREAMERLAQGAAQAELARSYGVSQSTISRLAAPGPFGASAAVA